MDTQSALRDAEVLKAFLTRELPRRSLTSADAVIRTVNAIGVRYERYRRAPKLGASYAERRRIISSARQRSIELWQCLSALDPIARDGMADRYGEEWVERLQGYLTCVANHMEEIERETQVAGKPRDLAAEYWVSGMARIYREYFREEPIARAAKFKRFLEAGSPVSMPASGYLDRRQVSRVLARSEKDGH